MLPVEPERTSCLKVQANHPAAISHRDKLRISDSELWTSDSEQWNGVYTNAVCTDQGNLSCRDSPATCLKLRIPDSELRISDSSTGIFDSAASAVAALMPVWHAGHLLV